MRQQLMEAENGKYLCLQNPDLSVQHVQKRGLKGQQELASKGPNIYQLSFLKKWKPDNPEIL